MSETAGTEVESLTSEMIPIYVMGKQYMVPDSLTIMKAMEYAGYKFVRGAGCRGGICGACGTVYRKPGDYRIHVGLACQTMVEPEMYLTQLPFFPAMRASYDWATTEAVAETAGELYPELFRCVACNACTKICPMDVEVMDYIAALKRGDLEAATEISFNCIQCGLCASRCMGELPQYHIAQLARRLYGGKLVPRVRTPRCDGRQDRRRLLQGQADGAQGDGSKDELNKLYQERQMEPHQGGEYWKPDSEEGL